MNTQVTFTSDGDDDVFPDDELPASPSETRDHYLSRTGAPQAKVRQSFVQVPRTATLNSQPGTLQQFNRNHRAAVLYLALVANWPWLRREEDPLPAEAWIRFLSCDQSGAFSPLTWTPQSLSHAWATLESLRLIEKARKGRYIDVAPLREDGSGEAYEAPKGVGDAYFSLPHEFWSLQLHGTLSWPALAVMLILLKETNDKEVAELPIARAQRFYGIGRTTAETGLVELRERQLLKSKDRFVKDADATKGKRLASLHALQGPFSTKNRQAIRSAARDRLAANGAANGGDATTTEPEAPTTE